MRRRVNALLLVLLLTVVAALPPGTASAATYVDPQLQARLASASSSTLIEAVANYDPRARSAKTLAGAIQDLGAGTITFSQLDSIAVIGTPSQIRQVAALAGVTELYANARLRYYLHESVPAIGADRAWTDFGATGRGIGIAVIDSGVDATHPDLAFGSKVVQNVKMAADLGDPTLPYSFKGRPGQPLYVEGVLNTDTTSGHGTHVAGIAAGSGAASGGYYTGVAKDAQLVGIGTGETIFVVWALAGFDYVLANAGRYAIKALNNSWGAKGKAAAFDPKDPINRASKKAHDRGITVVFAAGNDGPDADTMNLYAMAPWVIGVAAGCKPQEQGTDFYAQMCPDGPLAFFSSRGVAGDPQAHPTLTAPGVNVVAARALTGAVMPVTDLPFDAFLCNVRDTTRYTCASGTSMAAPHVAGTVALMQQACGGKLTPDQVKTILTSTAKPMYKTDGSRYGLWEAGAGYLDAYAAVQASKL